MQIEVAIENQFKPELKSSGRKLYVQEKVAISSGSETAIHAYVRVAPPAKVTLTTDSIDSPSVHADCNCPTAKKSRLCKHIWATLLATSEKYPDFLQGKLEINAPDAPAPTSEPHKPSFQESAAERASEYRKAQYQKVKARAKEEKRIRKGLPPMEMNSFPPEVSAALAYFSENGFPMPEGPSKEIMNEAKRKLSRFFHPDKGGSHEESVELNRNCEVLLTFLRE